MEWLRERLATIKEAAGFRWEVAGILVSFAIAKIDWVYQQFSSGSKMGDQMIFGFPSWILGITVFFLFISFWLLEYAVKLRKEREPKLKFEYDENDPTFFNHENSVQNHGTVDTIERRALVRIHNSSPCKTIEDMEIYCDGVEVISNQENQYRLKVTGSYHPVSIDPERYFTNGLVRQIIGDFHGTGKIEKEMQIQIKASKPIPELNGSEFKIKVAVSGRDTRAAFAEFQFGEKDGIFYCKHLTGRGK